MSDWKIQERNEILQGKGFHISYNPDTGADPLSAMMTKIGNALGEAIDAPLLTDGAETALVKHGKKSHTYYILTGDFRKEYEALIAEGFEACYDFFKERQPIFGNNWTTKTEDRP